jgi:hypothetical protein
MVDDLDHGHREAESTNIHRAERTREFAHDPRFRDRAVRSIGPEDVAAWLKGGKRNATVNYLRAWFNDGRRAQAGMLVHTNRSPT